MSVLIKTECPLDLKNNLSIKQMEQKLALLHSWRWASTFFKGVKNQPIWKLQRAIGRGLRSRNSIENRSLMEVKLLTIEGPAQGRKKKKSGVVELETFAKTCHSSEDAISCFCISLRFCFCVYMTRRNCLVFCAGCITCTFPVACLLSVVAALALKASVALQDVRNGRVCLLLRQFCAWSV